VYAGEVRLRRAPGHGVALPHGHFEIRDAGFHDGGHFRHLLGAKF